MSRQSYEFAFWGIIIVGLGVMLLMWQHMTHTQVIMSMLAGNPGGVSPQSAGPVAQDAQTLVAIDSMAGPGLSAGPATGIWTPVGPDGNN